MPKCPRWTIGLGWVCTVACLGLLVAGVLSCGTAPTAFLVSGPGQFGDEPPTLEIREPSRNITLGQGDAFLIRWNDTDRDSNAQIRFSLVNTTTNAVIVLIDNIDENDDTVSNHTVSTSLIRQGTYNLLGTISDDTTTVDVFAMTTGATPQRVVISIVPEGGGPLSEPPQILVAEPVVNLSMAQDDDLEIVIQPTAAAPGAANPFDPDSDITIYVVLDVDLDPTNDDPANPDREQLILLETRTVTEGAFQTEPFVINVDLAEIPPRDGGEPYFIRATADDGTNPRVHSYAVGTVNIVQLASGLVDLFDVGRSVSGAKFYGFNPGASVGSSITPVGDFDLDGADDFLFAAQFGNPQNCGPVGEAYVVYGRPAIEPQQAGDERRTGLRFGGAISVNSIGDDVSGAIFSAPPIRFGATSEAFPETMGITDVGIVRDLTGDNRPDLLFGLPLVHGAFDSTDYDPGDDPPDDDGTFFCYPDPIVNNFASEEDGPGPDSYFYSGGMGVMVSSQNRDNNGIINTARLESTVVDLEFAGQPGTVVLDCGGFNNFGSIFPRASNEFTPDDAIGTDEDEPGRIAGARFIAGGYDFLEQLEPPRADLYGHRVGSLGDLNSDGLDEVIMSAPTNERYINDLQTTSVPGRGFSTHLFSTLFIGSIIVLPGRNYNLPIHRDRDDEAGSAVTPFLDQHNHPPGSCSESDPVARHYDVPVDYFEIFAENIDDFLGDGQSAGDFNLDGLDDILCGAPLNDRTSSLRSSGATYIIYGRSVFGGIDLANANDPILRPPMLRIRGITRGDQIGSRQTHGLDVNGDRVDDVFIASPHTDYAGVSRATCAADFNGDGNINQSDLRDVSFTDCRLDFGDEVFSNDSCKAYDYDNDGDIDDDDRCVFCCLSDECEPDSTCTHGTGENCCANLVDNGFVAVIFGGRFTDGDRNIDQIATSDLPGTIFYGGGALHRAGVDVSSAGDFNHDGFGDILIAVPGEVRRDSAGRDRVGVVYLVFGGTHLTNTVWNLADEERGVGSLALPGLVFFSPYVEGRPNEAAPLTVGLAGDINDDGFDDIFIGNPKADFIDLSFPQGPDAPGSDAAAGRRRNAGDAYIVYGNNFGTNRVSP